MMDKKKIADELRQLARKIEENEQFPPLVTLLRLRNGHAIYFSIRSSLSRFPVLEIQGDANPISLRIEDAFELLKIIGHFANTGKLPPADIRAGGSGVVRA